MSETRRSVLLVVDDELLQSSNLRADLVRAGYTVLEAPDAPGGLRALADSHFDVVLADLRISDLDGTQFLQKVRDQSPGTRVIITSAVGTVDSAVEAMRCGAADYLTQPFSNDLLLQKIDQLTAADSQPEEDLQAQADLEQLFGKALALAGNGLNSGPVPVGVGGVSAPPTSAQMMAGLTETIAGVERRLIDAALKRAAGNQAKAAQFLRIPRTTLRDKMAKYGMVGETKRQAVP
jgi:DNA-binding NtrC family response regulator